MMFVRARLEVTRRNLSLLAHLPNLVATASSQHLLLRAFQHLHLPWHHHSPVQILRNRHPLRETGRLLWLSLNLQ